MINNIKTTKLIAKINNIFYFPLAYFLRNINCLLKMFDLVMNAWAIG